MTIYFPKSAPIQPRTGLGKSDVSWRMIVFRCRLRWSDPHAAAEHELEEEMLQNAEDAMAGEVALSLGPGGQGLCWANDACFRAQDWEGLIHLGVGSKKEGGTIGRFGLGFNAVYHVTDLPSFVSGRHAVFFDPHGTPLPNALVGPGRMLATCETHARHGYARSLGYTHPRRRIIGLPRPPRNARRPHNHRCRPWNSPYVLVVGMI